MRRNLPKGYREALGFGLMTYEVPLSRYPKTYNGKPLPYVCLAAQKNYFVLYLMCAYQDSAQGKALKDAFRRAGKKLDMGKSCIRFRALDDLPFDVIAKIVDSTPVDAFIAQYEAARRR